MPLEQTLQALRELQEAGRIRHAGVSNFPAGMMERALDIVPLLADQVEYHPFLDQDGAPATRPGPRLHADRLLPARPRQGPRPPRADRDRRGRTARPPGQVALRWLLDQPNVTTVPKASSHARRAENFEVFDFALTDDDRARIAALPKDVRTADPAWAPDWDA